MAGEWEEATLGAEADLLTGFPFRSARYTDADDGIRLVRGDNIVQGALRWDGVKRWPGSESAEYELYQLREGDVVLAMDRPWIEAGLKYAAISKYDLPCLLVQRTARLRGGPKLEARFLRYLIGSPEFTQHVHAITTGTAVPHISGRQIREFTFLLPPLEEQRAVAHILGTLDDKIALNRRMNETLEAMAQALFRSWFVNFDPVRANAEGRDPGLPQPLADLFPDSFEDSALGEIPRGWTVGALGDFLFQRVERCSASPETATRPYVPIDCISPKSLFLTESKPGEEAQSSLTKFYKGDILFGAMRPYFHKVCIAPFDGTTRTTAFVLYPRQADDFAFATLQLHHPETIDFATRHSTGSTIPYAVWTDSLNTMPVIAPPFDVRKAFNRLMQPVLLRIPEPYFENRALATLRDALLPKLISGELRVNDARSFIGSLH